MPCPSKSLIALGFSRRMMPMAAQAFPTLQQDAGFTTYSSGSPNQVRGFCCALCSFHASSAFSHSSFRSIPDPPSSHVLPSGSLSSPVKSRLSLESQNLRTPLISYGTFINQHLHAHCTGFENGFPWAYQKMVITERQPSLKSKLNMFSRLSCHISDSQNAFGDSCHKSDGIVLVSESNVQIASKENVRGAGFVSQHRETGEILTDAEKVSGSAKICDSEERTSAEDLQGDASKLGTEGAEMCSSPKARGQGEKRQRGAASVALPDGKFHDLLTVPGIGSKNMEKLVAKGIKRLVELKQLYRDNFLGAENEKMVEYLRSSVGIVHRNHASSIAAYIKSTVDEELKDEMSSNQGPHTQLSSNRLTFCVEGNISVGKTTFLQRIANETLELRDLVEVVPEPIEKWQNVGPDRFNILNAFYAEPARYAYTFQNYVFVTRLMQERESANGVKPLRLMERSVFSDRMVFVRAVHEAKWMNEMEISIYDSWFDPVVSQLPGLVPDGFIYLRASPDTCHKRLQSRKRPEENSVSLEYLQGLHEKHEQWLFPARTGSADLFSISKWPTTLKEPPPALIRDRVFYLEGEHVHTCLQKVPALVLDCEASIDFNKDLEAKAEYARQVAEFCDYVKRTKHVVGSQTTDVVSRPTGILGPDGSLLRATVMESDLRKHFSSFCS